MKLSYSLVVDESATAADIERVAQHAEAVRFSGLWVSDHVIMPVGSGTRAITDPPRPRGWYGRYRLEALTVLANLAGVTDRISLGTSVVVLAQREVILFAKQAATVDFLSSGRLRLGIGAGWIATEFALLGARFQDRGRRTDEAIRMCRQLWTDDAPRVVTDSGEAQAVVFGPQVTRPGGIPILIGGSSHAAVARAARLANGWMPVVRLTQESMAAFHAMHTEYVKILREARRPTAEVPVSVKLQLDRDDLKSRFARRASAVRLADAVEDFVSLGVDELIIDISQPPAPDEAMQIICRFAKEFLPLAS